MNSILSNPSGIRNLRDRSSELRDGQEMGNIITYKAYLFAKGVSEEELYSGMKPLYHTFRVNQ
jgi:hypothetical protein